jgi:hypothetical protein
MEVVLPQDPDGQHFLLREYLETVLAAAPFEGDAWTSCQTAFLTYRAIPVLGSNFTTLAPASFFLRLYESREPDFGTEREGHWGEAEFRRIMSEIGEQKVQQFVATDKSRSWVIYLSEDLRSVLAFHGRVRPGGHFDPRDDDKDLDEGEVIRQVLAPGSATVRRLDLSNRMAPTVELTAATGERYRVAFAGCRRISRPAPSNTQVQSIDEVRGRSGRSWFVFRGLESNQRLMVIQADSVEVEQF